MKPVTKFLFSRIPISIVLCLMLLLPPISASSSAYEPSSGPTGDAISGSASGSSSGSTEDITSCSVQESSSESSEKSTESSIPSSYSGRSVFRIDNQHIYTGMDESYHNGYTPEVKNEKAILILPLISSRDLKDDQLTASLDLGKRAKNPFLFKNYQKTISLSSQKIKDSADKRDIYYVRFDLSLSASRINGAYPVGISITAEDTQGNEITEAFTVYITITDGKAANEESSKQNDTMNDHYNDNGDNSDNNANNNKDNNGDNSYENHISNNDDNNNISDNSYENPIGGTGDNNDISDNSHDSDIGDDSYRSNIGGGNDSAAETKPSSQPIILVTKSACKPGAATAGEPFQVVITLSNTSKKKSIQNMVVSVSCDSPDLTLLNDTNTIYIESMDKGASTNITLNYQAEKKIADGKYTINLSMSYDNADAETLSSSGSITVSVQQPLSVEMTMPQIASSAAAGDTLPLNFQVMNLGRSKIHNVRCEISGDGLYPMGTAFIGDMEAGSSQETSLNLFIGSKSGSSDKENGDTAENSSNAEGDSDKSSDSSDDEFLYGPTQGTATLIYEDSNGKEYREPQTFYLTIEKPVIQTDTTDESDTQERASQWWISILIAGGLLAAAGIAFLLTRHSHSMNIDE